jgi:hypothetical protein
MSYTATRGRYTATWVILAHSGTNEKEETDPPILRTGIGEHYRGMGMDFKCYRPPGDELASVIASAIPGSSVTNFGMTLTVAHDAACRTDDKSEVFNIIVDKLKKLDKMVDVKYTTGGQEIINTPEDKTIFMHPMPTDHLNVAAPYRPIRKVRGDMVPFPSLGLYLVQVYHTDTGLPVDDSVLGPLLPYVLGRHCDDIDKITQKTIESNDIPGIPLHPDKKKFGSTRHLFDTLRHNKLPEYFLDPGIRSEEPSAKKYVSDFEIFRGKNSSEIYRIISKYERARRVQEAGHADDVYSSITGHYLSGVKRKRITLFNLQKVCALLSPPGTVMGELFIIGCRDPYPKAPSQFSVNSNLPIEFNADHVASATTFNGSLNTPTGTTTPGTTTPGTITPGTTTPGTTTPQVVPHFSQFIPRSASNSPLSARSRSASKSPRSPRSRSASNSPLSPRSRRASKSPGNKGKAQKVSPGHGGGKKHKTRHGNRNKSLNVQNKSRSRRTRRHVIKRKNN